MKACFGLVLLGFSGSACSSRSDAGNPPAALTGAGAAVPARRLPPAAVPRVAADALPAVVASRPAPLAPESTPEESLSEEPRIVLAAGGDVNLGRECGQEILKNPSYEPFAGLALAWTQADARFVNLESQLSDQNGVTQSPKHRLIFTGPPAGADVLAQSRISVVSTANNHAWDYGKSALLSTLENLDRRSLAHAGTGSDLEGAYRPAILRVKGRSLALFAVTQVWNQPPFHSHEGKDFVAWADLAKLGPRIEQARREHDFVIVSYHGGEEYSSAPVERTREFVKAVMALGVDVVIGHHPHVPQGVGWVERRPVIYSLGNLVFAGHDDRPWTKLGFFALITLQRGEPPGLAACPVVIDGHRPRSLDPHEDASVAERFRLHFRSASTSTGGSIVDPADERGCLPVTPPPRRQPSARSSSN